MLMQSLRVVVVRPVSIILGKRGLTMTNALAYHTRAQFTAVKIVIAQATDKSFFEAALKF